MHLDLFFEYVLDVVDDVVDSLLWDEAVGGEGVLEREAVTVACRNNVVDLFEGHQALD